MELFKWSPQQPIASYSWSGLRWGISYFFSKQFSSESYPALFKAISILIHLDSLEICMYTKKVCIDVLSADFHFHSSQHTRALPVLFAIRLFKYLPN